MAPVLHTHPPPGGEGGGREGGGGSDLPPATACPTSTARVSIWRGREASGSVDTSSKREHQHLSGEQTARAKQTGAARVRRTPGLSMARRLGGRCTVNSRSTHGQLTVNSTVNSRSTQRSTQLSPGRLRTGFALRIRQPVVIRTGKKLFNLN